MYNLTLNKKVQSAKHVKKICSLRQLVFSELPWKWLSLSMRLILHDSLCTLWQKTNAPFLSLVSFLSAKLTQEKNKTRISWTAEPHGRPEHWQPITIPLRRRMLYRHSQLWGSKHTHTRMHSYTFGQHICVWRSAMWDTRGTLIYSILNSIVTIVHPRQLWEHIKISLKQNSM